MDWYLIHEVFLKASVKITKNGLLQIRSTKKFKQPCSWTSVFWKNILSVFWGRCVWGRYVIGICRKCHKSGEGVQVDWSVRALRRVGEISELSRPIAVMNWEKNFL